MSLSSCIFREQKYEGSPKPRGENNVRHNATTVDDDIPSVVRARRTAPPALFLMYSDAFLSLMDFLWGDWFMPGLVRMEEA